jgi:hypothetical protein
VRTHQDACAATLAAVNAELRQLAAVERQLLDLKRRNNECLDAAPGAWSCAVRISEGGET